MSRVKSIDEPGPGRPVHSRVASTPFAVQTFVPRRFLTNGHVQTVAGNFLPRASRLPAPVSELVEVSAATGTQIATEVLCQCHWQPAAVRAGRPTAIIVHGLEGSDESQYVLGNAGKLWRAGANIIRMNMRNCGGRNFEMARRTPTLYHSGLSGDVDAVMRHFLRREGLESIALIGYSMGGNLVLKLAGEWGSEPPLCAVAAVCPAIDLALGADALHEPLNRAYEWKFLRGLRTRYARKVELFPGKFVPAEEIGPIRSIREFDHKIVSRYCGFRDADDYYYRAASARVVDRIAVPTFILHAQDDPFIRMLPETRAKLLDNQHIALVETRHGGHCAYLSRDPGNEIHWAEATVIRFVKAVADQSHGNQAHGS